MTRRGDDPRRAAREGGVGEVVEGFVVGGAVGQRRVEVGRDTDARVVERYDCGEVVGLACDGVGLLIAREPIADITRREAGRFGSLRQSSFGGLAVAASYVMGFPRGASVD
ncbi:MAG: hypothetical protein M3O32_13550 [Actinomycetota bacterium]|nr:hypothetical protein [Actinomycetota bacterium]